MDEFLMGRAKLTELPADLISNAQITVNRVNNLLEKFGEYRKVNSGYRRPEDNNKVPNPKAHSKHLTCQACDLEDVNAGLYNFCRSNEPLMKEIGLWFEERQGGWTHCQIVPPASGKRWFIP